MHSKRSFCGFWHWCGTSKLQYEPSGAQLSLLKAEIRSISHETSLAVKDLKITAALGKVDFSNKFEHFLGQPKDLLFTYHHVVNVCTTKPGQSK